MAEARKKETNAGPFEGVRQLWERLPFPYFTNRPAYHWYVVGTVCVGAFMAALDASIVNVAMPTLTQAFHQGLGVVAWVSIAYLLTLTSLLTMFGRLADMIGRRNMYTFGFSVFIIGSALCGAALNMPMLIVSRILQATGAAMLQANSVAIITAAVPGHERGKAIGIQGSAQAIGLSLGPAVGGLLITMFGWRSIFYVNVPVGILGTSLAAMILPKDQVAQKKQPFDYVGSASMAAALVLLLMSLTDYRAGLLSFQVLGQATLAVALLGFWAWWEGRIRFPMVDLNLFRIPVFTMGNISGLLSYSVMFGVFFLMPFYLEQVMGHPPSATGLLLTPVPLAMTILAPLAGGLSDKLGSRLLTTLGMLSSTLGALLLTMLGRHTSFLLVMVELALVGAGLGLFTPPNNSSVMGSVPSERLGVAGGILNMARSLGMSMGAAFSGSLFGMFLLLYGHSEHTRSIPAMLHAFSDSFWGIVILGAIATGISVLKTPAPKTESASEAVHQPLEW